MWRTILIGIFLVLLPVSSARAEEKIESDSVFVDWSAFFDDQDCWISTFVVFGMDDISERIVYYVTFHNQSPEPRVSFSTDRGDGFFDTPSVFAGEQEIEFGLHEEFAYPIGDEEIKLFRAMLEGKRILIKIPMSADESISGFVSLRGFREAYNYISNECVFDFIPDLSDKNGFEPT